MLSKEQIVKNMASVLVSGLYKKMGEEIKTGIKEFSEDPTQFKSNRLAFFAWAIGKDNMHYGLSCDILLSECDIENKYDVNNYKVYSKELAKQVEDFGFKLIEENKFNEELDEDFKKLLV